ncbi:MAG: alginate O-acetyltransferase AlgX-related protein [Solidesulfovibrio sp. DCME]|uniref:alginate O-acetyltransferase AlgX-related protein n=1 Tax=Solidesulfovibrio sp. DCME TaxID=3447380 RepID=UPI003D0F188E
MQVQAPTLGHKAIACCGILVFLALICLPMIDNLCQVAPDVYLMENDPTPLPDSSMSQIFKSFNVLQRGYLEKTFGFRKLLVRLENILDIFWLRVSNQYQTVIKGKGDWLFLSQENNDLNVIQDYRSVRLFSQKQLNRWVDVYRDRQEWLSARGIRYLIVVAPNKHTVYPEFLPDQFNKVSPVSRTDQLVSALEAAGITVLDLRPTMDLVKRQALAYYRTDTHWTTFGAFAGYVQIMKRLGQWFPRFEPEIRGDYDIAIVPDLNGGLASMLALGDFFPESRVVFTPHFQRKAVETAEPHTVPPYFQPPVIMNTNDPSRPSVVVFRDSFAHELIPFLSEHFNKTTYVWPYPSTAREVRYFDKDLIEREKPAVVIDEFVERYFTEFPAKQTPPAAPAP